MSFIPDPWGREWSVGSWGSYEIGRKECEVEIDSEDYATLQSELDGSKTGTIDVKTVGGTHGADVTTVGRGRIVRRGARTSLRRWVFQPV